MRNLKQAAINRAYVICKLLDVLELYGLFRFDQAASDFWPRQRPHEQFDSSDANFKACEVRAKPNTVSRMANTNLNST
jgi:hypothetical protein